MTRWPCQQNVSREPCRADSGLLGAFEFVSLFRSIYTFAYYFEALFAKQIYYSTTIPSRALLKQRINESY